jgi:hypothetical protein
VSAIPISGWWYTYPPEKYERQIGMILPNYWGNKSHVPNHQPANIDDFPMNIPYKSP